MAERKKNQPSVKVLIPPQEIFKNGFSEDSLDKPVTWRDLLHTKNEDEEEMEDWGGGSENPIKEASSTKAFIKQMKNPLPRVSGKPEFITGPLPINKKGETSFVFLTDQHYPFDLFTDGVLKMLSENTPDYLIISEPLNMDPFNHWAAAKPKKNKEMPNPKPYYESACKEFFKPLREAVGSETIIVCDPGNHGHWANKAIDMNPQGFGYWEIENNLEPGLVDYVVPYRQGVSLGNLWFYHGDNISERYTQNHARKMSERYHRNAMYGHFHEYAVHSLDVAPDEKPIVAISVPCLTNLNPISYGKNIPHNRSHGFAYGLIRKDGDFDAWVVQVKNAEWVFGGKRYKAKMTSHRKVTYEM